MIANYISASSTPDFFICYDVELLLMQLQRNDFVERQHARETLGCIGKAVVPDLIELLDHSDEHVRWEACKTLAKIRDPRAGYALAEALLDDDADVRWVAAKALIALECHAIEPLLHIIKIHFDSVLLREAAHHVLRELKREDILDEKVEAVYDALGSNVMPMRLVMKVNEALECERTKRISIPGKATHSTNL